ncbi:uncharacterized protein [Physcomitrium patens]|uniref:Uncharacterized protein n=1 Tax=Physcomitrium patens TaxID=3218 RepID=A0A2K1KK85_PHYPA|nr:hypothetical protein PHYPA_007850 [Physcomitrium patens]
MTSLAEMFDCREAPNMPTYSESESGYAYNYQVSIQVSVDLTDTRQRRLEAHFNRQRGYDSCVCNRLRNVVTILHMGGIRRTDVMRYIRRSIDPNARELA